MKRLRTVHALGFGAFVLFLLGLMWLYAPLSVMGKEAPPPAAGPVVKKRDAQNPMPAGWQPPDQVEAEKRASQPRPFVVDVIKEDPKLRQLRFKELGLGVKDIKHRYALLGNSFPGNYTDQYRPVRFMHSKHAASVDSNCALCHHASPKGADAVKDRLSETVACRACHQEAFDPKHPERLGLSAAYHQQCMGCHKKMNQGPVDCKGCHAPNVKDHKELVRLPDNPTPMQVTQECLRCHPKAGEDMLKTAHWLWKGPSPYTIKRQKKVMSGKATDTINNFCMALPSNWPRCTSCHAGYGWKDETFDFKDKTRIDCLVCHDTTDSYMKAPPAAGMPDPKVDLVYVAKNVGKTSRNTCGNCHFQGGGGDAVKHAEMSGVLRWPDRNCDIHMGGYGFSCSECHKTVNHKILGRSSSLPVAEGSRSCEDCHSRKPHSSGSLLDHHLNKHSETVACNTCHTPVYSKCKATKTWWDWSMAGDKKRKPVKDKTGSSDYDWMKGEFEWKESKKPVYTWSNGFMERMLIGDVISGAPDSFGSGEQLTRERKKQMKPVHITRPVGSMKDPSSRIYPFKVMDGIQPADAVNNYLLVPHLFPRGPEDTTAYWKNLNWQKAFEDGMNVTKLKYSGKYKWVRTNMYWAINHEVSPKEMALSCSHCHESLAGQKTCNRCHKDSRNADYKALVAKGTDFKAMLKRGRDVSELIGTTDYLGFKALGYKGDPILTGGRFSRLPLHQHKN